MVQKIDIPATARKVKSAYKTLLGMDALAAVFIEEERVYSSSSSSTSLVAPLIKANVPLSHLVPNTSVKSLVLSLF